MNSGSPHCALLSILKSSSSPKPTDMEITFDLLAPLAWSVVKATVQPDGFGEVTPDDTLVDITAEVCASLIGNGSGRPLVKLLEALENWKEPLEDETDAIFFFTTQIKLEADRQLEISS